jgi:hypothetical protein
MRRLFTEILNRDVTCTEIQFNDDGSWRPSRPDSDECWVSDSPPAASASSRTTNEDASAVKGLM